MLQHPLAFLGQRKWSYALVITLWYFCGGTLARDFSADSFLEERLLIKRKIRPAAGPNSMVH
jgi:hypothetical protein